MEVQEKCNKLFLKQIASWFVINTLITVILMILSTLYTVYSHLNRIMKIRSYNWSLSRCIAILKLDKRDKKTVMDNTSRCETSHNFRLDSIMLQKLWWQRLIRQREKSKAHVMYKQIILKAITKWSHEIFD